MSIATEITRLQTAKADLKTSIEGKGVYIPISATLDDYSNYVDDIQQTSPNWIKYICCTSNMFRNVVFSEETVTIDFDGATLTESTSGMFQGVQVKNLIIKNFKAIGVPFYNAFSMVNVTSVIETITFDNCEIAPTDIQQLARYATTLKSISGEIDMSNATNTYDMFRNCYALTSIRFKANSLSAAPVTMNYPPFDDDTLVNIGNSLNGSVSGQTLTLSSAKKTRCGTIIGTNDNGTFVANDQGNLSLADFITNVKGWTLA